MGQRWENCMSMRKKSLVRDQDSGLYPGCVTKWWCFWISHVLNLASSSLHLEIRLGHGSNTKGQVGYKPPKSRIPTFPVIRNDITVKSFPGAFHIQVETLWGFHLSHTPTLLRRHLWMCTKNGQPTQNTPPHKYEDFPVYIKASLSAWDPPYVHLNLPWVH